MKSFEKIYNVVSKIPKGKVSTYGALANLAGVNPRVVGYALHANRQPNIVPCHRVIKANGTIARGYAFGGPQNQKKILVTEGIKFDKNGKVDLLKFGYFLL